MELVFEKTIEIDNRKIIKKLTVYNDQEITAEMIGCFLEHMQIAEPIGDKFSEDELKTKQTEG